MPQSTSLPPLPPGQQLVATGKWPLVGERTPLAYDGPWTVAVGGAVALPRTWTLAELRELPNVMQTIDIHCVTRWSKLAVPFVGVRLANVLEACQPLSAAHFISFVARSQREHGTSLPLSEALAAEALLAWDAEGTPLAEAHGGPLRVVVPGRYFYKSLKWLARIELLDSDRLGYWESVAGYHNHADPWREQRYLSPDLDKRTVARLLAARDFSGQNLRSLSVRGHELGGLQAAGALLRDADFRDAQLVSATFARANLSNAHFEGADLRHASFVGADLEGASFVGADLRGADFTGALLTAATFASGDGGQTPAAIIDATTRFDATALESLMPLQQDFLTNIVRQ